MASLSLPPPSARAAMVATEAVIARQVGDEAERRRVRAVLERAEVRARLEAYGVDPAEALARVDALSDREVAEIADRLDELPAGAGGEVVLAVVLVLGLVVFWIIELVLIVGGTAKLVDTVIQGSRNGEPLRSCGHLRSPEKEACERAEQERREEAKRLEAERQAAIAESERQEAEQEAELERRARRGEPEAELALYYRTPGAAGWTWLCRAANHGHPRAQVETGRLYWYGLPPVEQDPVRGYLWAGLAAAQGFEGGRIDAKDRRPLLSPEQLSEAERLVAAWQPDPAACVLEGAATD